MQETRKQILQILHDHGEIAVDEIVRELEQTRGSITPVTVRHHLAKLQENQLVEIVQMRHRDTPGRPQHLYRLTAQGESHFPNNYPQLTVHLLNQIQNQLPVSQVNVIIEGMVDSMVGTTPLVGTLEERLVGVVNYLNEHGYQAQWEADNEGYLLHTHNCPYHRVAQENGLLCQLDMRLIAKMLGVVPRLLSRIATQHEVCSYFIPKH